MPTSERRLLALLNLMTTSNPGERANATEAACRYILSRQITWAALQTLAGKLRDAKVLDAIYNLLFKKPHSTDTKMPPNRPNTKSQPKAEPAYKTCAQCGNDFRTAYGSSEPSPDGTSYGRPRVYCNDACKMKAYRARRTAEKKRRKSYAQ